MPETPFFSCFIFLHLLLFFCNSVTSTDIPHAKDSHYVERRAISIHRALIEYFHLKLTEFDSIDPPTTALPSSPITNTVATPAVNTAPGIVTVPGTNPVTNPINPPLPITNPVNSPGTVPGNVTIPGAVPGTIPVNSPGTVPSTVTSPGAIPGINPANPLVPVTNPVNSPVPSTVTAPGAVPVTNPVNPPVPVTNPISSPVPITNPVNSPVPVTNPVNPPGPVTNPVTTPSTNPVTTPTQPSSRGQSWCVAKNGASQTALQSGLDYACGIGGADCVTIQQGSTCYEPATLQNHASYAFNSYYQKNPNPTSCDFGGAAAVTTANPSTGSCVYPSSASSSSSSAVPTTPTTPTTTTQAPVNQTSFPTAPPTSSSGSTFPGTQSPPPGFSIGNTDPTGLGAFGASPPLVNTASSVSKNLSPFIVSLVNVASVVMFGL